MQFDAINEVNDRDKLVANTDNRLDSAMQYHFEWDPIKAAVNIEKHGVSFEQATEVFKDPIALSIYDQENSGEEERWVTLGQVQQQHYLVVIHTYRDQQNEAVTIRLISARPATKHEITQYEG